MKLIAQRRFQHADKDVEIGQTIDVSESTGKELLAIGNLVITEEVHAEAQAAKESDAARANINGGVDERSPVNPPPREKDDKPAATRKTKPAPGPAETK